MNAVAPTDNDWFNFLKNYEDTSLINFWTPTPWNPQRLKQGDKFYFLLKAPIRKIGGFGEFVEYRNLPAKEVWNEWGYRNGCLSFDFFMNRIISYVKKNSKGTSIQLNPQSHILGNIILANCEFWDESEYLNVDVPDQVVKLKYYENLDIVKTLIIKNFDLVTGAKDKRPSSTTIRVGQSSFSSKIFSAYNYKCCISGESCLEILHAGHIQPYINRDSHHIQNGLLLRIDLHYLYDNNLLFINSDYKVYISDLVESDYYRKLHGVKIFHPANKNQWPSKIALEERRIKFRNTLPL